MLIKNMWLKEILRAPDGGGDGGDGGGDGGDDAAAAAAAAAAAGGDGGDGGDGKQWWDGDAFKQEDRDFLTKKGLTIEDRDEVFQKTLKGWQGAERRLGKPAESMMDRPAEGQTSAEFMRANAEMFGLPEAADGYEIEKPEMPEGVEWDSEFESAAREIAFEEGVSPAALNRFTKAYADKVGGLMTSADNDLQASNKEMMSSLETDWGQQTGAKIAMAQRAAQAIGEKAGLDTEGLQSLSMAMKPKIGDAGIIKMFAAIGDMMGEDTLIANAGSTNLGSTPAEARAELAAMNAPDGAFGKASATGNKAEMARLKPQRDALYKIAAGA